MRRDDVEAGIDLLRRVDTGELDGLPCPKCGELNASAWFTQPAPDEFKTWIVCGCGFELRAQCDKRPIHYSADRVRNDLQEYDKRLARDRKFPAD